MRLVLWRHGQTEWNSQGRMQGRCDVALNDVGRKQAVQAAQVLASRYSPDALWSSSLRRAHDTAQELGLVLDMPVMVDSRLVEVDMGSWEGLKYAEVLQAYPNLVCMDPRVKRGEFGESDWDVAQRMAEALRDITSGLADEATCVVATHGLASKMAVCGLLEWVPESFYQLGLMHNCGWAELERLSDGRWRLISWDEHCDT